MSAPTSPRSETGPAAFRPGQIVTVFRSRLRPPVDVDYGDTADAMLALARTMPGFVDFKSFAADDGERVSLVTFADAASQRAWRDQVDHRAAQQTGRDRFYVEYHLQVGTCTTAHTFTAPT